MPGRTILAAFFVVAGSLHFLFPGPYLHMMPPFLPWPRALVWISGAAEIAGGAGLLWLRWRRTAALGLVLLLIAVFPANIYMAVAHVRFSGLLGQSWVPVAPPAVANSADCVGLAVHENQWQIAIGQSTGSSRKTTMRLWQRHTCLANC